jgi:hypothetical protein
MEKAASDEKAQQFDYLEAVSGVRPTFVTCPLLHTCFGCEFQPTFLANQPGCSLLISFNHATSIKKSQVPTGISWSTKPQTT